MKYVNIPFIILCIAALPSQAATISVNLTQSGAPSETGFTNWVSANNSLPSDLVLTLGSDSLTFSAPSTGINSGTNLRSIDRGARALYTGSLPSLSQTWWGQRQGSTTAGGFITINVAGLSAGDYSFTSWHLDFNDQTGFMDIQFSNNGGTSFTSAISPFDLVSFDTDGATDTIVQTFNFTATGADVQFRFRNTAGTTSPAVFPVVNGFEITVIPEPSAALLGGLGLLALLRRRR